MLNLCWTCWSENNDSVVIRINNSFLLVHAIILLEIRFVSMNNFFPIGFWSCSLQIMNIFLSRFGVMNSSIFPLLLWETLSRPERLSSKTGALYFLN